ncbi:MAG: hypothetical protein WC517_03205 [Patescibacteria group bacterium]
MRKNENSKGNQKQQKAPKVRNLVTKTKTRKGHRPKPVAVAMELVPLGARDEKGRMQSCPLHDFSIEADGSGTHKASGRLLSKPELQQIRKDRQDGLNVLAGAAGARLNKKSDSTVKRLRAAADEYWRAKQHAAND